MAHYSQFSKLLNGGLESQKSHKNGMTQGCCPQPGRLHSLPRDSEGQRSKDTRYEDSAASVHRGKTRESFTELAEGRR